jgi:hypothetical protein
MKSAILVAIVILAGKPVLASAQMPHGHQSDSAECASLPADLKAVVAAMENPGRILEALATRADMPPLTPATKRLDIMLQPADGVSLIATPKAEKTDGKTFAGFVLFSLPNDGNYRVSSKTALWIDVLDGDKALKRAKLDRRMSCGRVHKSLGFVLKAGVNYWLQLSGSKGQEAHLMITSE